jgi:hypothetical protein
MGDDLFSGDPARQATPDCFYSGGGEVVVVTDLASARRALRLIAEQGEGFGGGIFDHEHELAHYYRFEQLVLGRYYLKDDRPGSPTGPLVDVDWEFAYPVLRDARTVDYPADSELRRAAEEFNASYGDFLGMLTTAFNGQPGLLLDAVVVMFELRDAMLRLLRNPVPGLDGVTAAPTFEIHAGAGAAATTASASSAATR